MAGGAAQVHQAAFGQHDDAAAGLEGPLVHLGLDVQLGDAGGGLQVVHVDLVVEVTDVADDGFVLHAFHVFAGDDAQVAGAGDVDVAFGQGVFHGGDFKAFHGGLQGADGVDLGHQHAGAEAAHGLGAALAHVAVAHHDHDLAGHHDVGGALDAVGQGLAAAVEVVELGLGHGVVDVDGREEQLAFGFQLVEAVHAGGGLFGDALHLGGHFMPVVGIFLVAQGQTIHDDLEFLVVVGLFQQGGIVFHFHALVDHQGGVAAVVHDQVGALAVRPGQGHFGAPPVIFQALALPGEDLGHALLGDGGSGVVLGGEDVARGPADVRAQGVQGLDEHGGLDGHVQGAGHAQALEGLLVTVLADALHEAGHLALGELHFLLAEIGQGHVGHFVGQGKVQGFGHRSILLEEVCWAAPQKGGLRHGRCPLCGDGAQPSVRPRGKSCVPFPGHIPRDRCAAPHRGQAFLNGARLGEDGARGPSPRKYP